MNAAKRPYALQDLTWTEFAERTAAGPVPIVLPLGSQEEQGPHAPMGDFVVAERIALAAAERAGAICAPVLPFGYAEFFRGIAGGMQLRADTFRRVLRDMIDSFTDHGLDHVVIVNGHSTNASLIADVAHQVRRDTGVLVPALHLWRMLPDSLWQQIHGENAAAARGHGADPLTSVTMHMAPELVRPDLIEGSARRSLFGCPTQPQFGGIVFEDGAVDLPFDAAEVAPNGVGGGDAAYASPEKGEAMTAWLVDRAARFIDYFRQCDPRDPMAAVPARDRGA
jgi:creatinine amidohydrolase